MPSFSRQLVAQINLAALRHNLDRVHQCVQGAQALAVVKADAYGHGLFRVLPALGNAEGLALLELDAAVALRRQHYTRRLLLLEGFFSEEDLREISKHRIAAVVHHPEQVAILERTKLKRSLEVFLKVNTGMNRLGIKPNEVAMMCERLNASSAVAALRLMTHLGQAETRAGAEAPLAIFKEACRGLPYPRTIANSAGVLRFSDVGGDIVRPGLMLYGVSPLPERTAASLDLQPVMSLRSELIAVQDVPAGQYVGYSDVFKTTRPTRIGVVACGYADGYPVTARNGTPVRVAGKLATLAGRVSMDMITVDITDIPEARVGSPVLLWGDGLPVEEVARWSGSIPYQLLCGITRRVRFITTEVGRIDFEL
ncbi:MAG: alanine racemase [Proteobacteria bacterium]|nr:alanine racemase [Pseudomonadota bacterium]MCL2308029.1 alanine racemase [Pseudomonadota bacterium]